MWNGYPVAGLVTKEGGAAKNSILTMKSGIVTRAVLYDIPRLKGVPYLEPGARIFPADLEAWEKENRSESRGRRCPSPSLGTMGAAGEARAVADRRGGGGFRQFGHSVAEEA